MPFFSGIWGVYHFRGITDFRRSYFIRRKANNMEKALSVKLSAFSGGDEDDKSETVLSSDNVKLLALSLKLK